MREMHGQDEKCMDKRNGKNDIKNPRMAPKGGTNNAQVSTHISTI